MKINVVRNILQSNGENADRIREILRENRVFHMNLISAPGAGKTTLLERLLPRLLTKKKVAIIEGDLYTMKDAKRLEAYEIPIVQINTEGGCHLDAKMIQNALNHLYLDKIDILITENVGNLVCPAEFDIGENIKLMVASVTEGNDKPLKYPLMFEKSDAVILNKIDLLPYTNFRKQEFITDVRSIHPDIPFFPVSCFKDEGTEEICQWIQEKVNSCLS